MQRLKKKLNDHITSYTKLMNDLLGEAITLFLML